MCLNFFKEEIKINKLLYYFIIFCLFFYAVYTSYGIYKQKKSMGSIEAERHQEYMKEQRRQTGEQRRQTEEQRRQTEEQRRQTEILKEIQRQNQQK